MQDNTGKVVLGLLGMVALWIAVYWWWPVDPPVSFAQSQPAPHVDAAVEATPEPKPAQSLPRQSPAAILAQHPPVAPAEQGGVIAPMFIQHTIGVGETVESISKMYYGTTAHAGAILAANPTKNPPDLKTGRVINVPKDPRNIQGVPVAATPPAGSDSGSASPTEYVVQQGDVLGKISQKVYGTSRHANLIFEANKDTMKNANSVHPGQRLRIPPAPAASASGN